MSTISKSTHKLLQFSMLKGVGPAALKKAAAVPGFEELDVEKIGEHVSAIAKGLTSPVDWKSAVSAAEKQILEAEKNSTRIISGLDAEYPALLAGTKDDPFILFVQGRLAPDPEKSAAVIGTREPTPHGELIATRITSFLVEQGWSIVSGLAIGSDAVAHRAALNSKGHTVAVLAHGLHTIAPTRHKKLAAEILESGGALLSEYPFGQEIQKQQYVKRDRIQAGLAQGVVMIQSDLVGGSLHASRAALDYERWLAVPYPTEKDRKGPEPKVQANLRLADGTDSERMELLRCSKTALRKVIILRSKQDYLRLLSPLAESSRIDDSIEQDTFDMREESAANSDSEAASHYFDDFRDQAFETPADALKLRVPTIEELTARQKYIAGKLREIDTFLDCLVEASPISRWELQFDLESVLAQMANFVVKTECRLDNFGFLNKKLRIAVSALANDIAVFQKEVVRGCDSNRLKEEHDLASLHVAGSEKMKRLRTMFQEFVESALQLLHE